MKTASEQYPTTKQFIELIKVATNIPDTDISITKEEMFPLVQILHVEKRMGWQGVANWIRDNHKGLSRSATFWMKLYKEGKKSLETPDKKN